MTTSNQNPASQNTNAVNQPNLCATLVEIKNELLKAKTLCGFHGTWIKKCYDLKREKVDKSILNAIRIISNRTLYHLQSAQAIACHIKEQSPLVYGQIQDTEAGALILANPLFNAGPAEILALLSIAEDFSENLDNCVSFVNSEISRLGNKSDHNFDLEQVDFSTVDPLPAYDLDAAARLDVAYASLVAMLNKVMNDDGKAFVDDPADFIAGLGQIASGLKNILPNCVGEEITSSVTDALNYLDFIENAFQKNLINTESADKYRWSVSAILGDAATSLRQAAESANYDQANEILRSRGDDAADTLH